MGKINLTVDVVIVFIKFRKEIVNLVGAHVGKHQELHDALSETVLHGGSDRICIVLLTLFFSQIIGYIVRGHLGLGVVQIVHIGHVLQVLDYHPYFAGVVELEKQVGVQDNGSEACNGAHGGSGSVPSETERYRDGKFALGIVIFLDRRQGCLFVLDQLVLGQEAYGLLDGFLPGRAVSCKNRSVVLAVFTSENGVLVGLAEVGKLGAR